MAVSGEKAGCNDALAWIEQDAQQQQASSGGSSTKSTTRETRPLGSLRASLGYLSTKADVAALADFVAGFVDRVPPPVGREDVAGMEAGEGEPPQPGRTVLP